MHMCWIVVFEATMWTPSIGELPRVRDTEMQMYDPYSLVPVEHLIRSAQIQRVDIHV